MLARAWRYHFRDYVIIANPRPDAMLRVPAVLLKPQWGPLFETRRDQKELLTKFNEDYYLPPYRVLVLKSGLKFAKPKT